MADLFDQSAKDSAAAAHRPLADRIRPAALSEVIGQENVLGHDGPLGAMIAAGSLWEFFGLLLPREGCIVIFFHGGWSCFNTKPLQGLFGKTWQ